MGEPTAIERARANDRNTLLALVEKNEAAIVASLPKHIKPERMMRLVRTAIQSTPALWECHPSSVLGSLVEASELGLEPNGPLGDSYLVPFFNKRTRRKESQLIVAYRGYIELADRTGKVAFVEAEVVHKGDTFSYQQGMDPKLNFTRALGKDKRGPAVAVYALVRYKDGNVKFVVLDVDEIEEIRECSNAKDGDAWRKWWGEMAKKTALRRLFKHVRLSPEIARATYLDESTDGGVRPGEGASTVFEGEQQVGDLKAKLAQAGAAAEPAEDDAIDAEWEQAPPAGQEDGAPGDAGDTSPEPVEEAPEPEPEGPMPWEPLAINKDGSESSFACKANDLRKAMVDAGSAAGMADEKLEVAWRGKVMKFLGELGCTTMAELDQKGKNEMIKRLAVAVQAFEEAVAEEEFQH